MRSKFLLFFAVFVHSVTAVKDSYIIKFKDGIDASQVVQFIERENSLEPSGEKAGKVKYLFSPKAFNGFAGTFKSNLLKKLKRQYMDVIEYVEEDGVITTFVEQVYGPWVLKRLSRPVVLLQKLEQKFEDATEYTEEDKKVKSFGEQPDAPWGLKRISTPALVSPLPPYKYDDRAGAGVTVFVMDTGLNVNLSEFNGRIKGTYNAITRTRNVTDVVGHGTHCAGTIGSTTYGSAKLVSLYPVKVLSDDGSGSFSDLIAGIDHVLNTATNGSKVMSMSLGGSKSRSVNDAVTNAHKLGVVSAVAAGNNNRDACQYSPASAAESITVGATDSSDRRASFSNFGPCVDLFAPGVKILSITPSGRPEAWDGTSMACPHVAGTLALFLSIDPTLTAPQLRAKLLSTAKSLAVGKFLYNQP